MEFNKTTYNQNVEVLNVPEGLNRRAKLLFHQVGLQAVRRSGEVVRLGVFVPRVGFGRYAEPFHTNLAWIKRVGSGSHRMIQSTGIVLCTRTAPNTTGARHSVVSLWAQSFFLQCIAYKTIVGTLVHSEFSSPRVASVIPFW